MPRRSAIAPELRTLLTKAAELKQQQLAKARPIVAARRQLAVSVTNAGKSFNRLLQMLAEWDARPIASKCMSVIDVAAAHFSASEKERGRFALLARIAEAEAEMARRETILAIFDSLHQETTV